jgi:FAD:protein FMN transferase
MPLQSPVAPEESERFACFGGTCALLVRGSGPAGSAGEALARSRRRMLQWHAQFSRFDPLSELSRLNRDARETVPVSPMMGLFVEAALGAAAATGGLVDPTLIGELEDVGYTRHFGPASLPLAEALALAPARQAGRPSTAARWREVQVDRCAGTVTRPPGLRLDSGGVAKGLFADVLASVLGGHFGFAVDAAGDLRFGGRGEPSRRMRVASPFDCSILHVFEAQHGAAATSGISRRSWLERDGRPAHHLLDPASGRPAFTGIVQATALAPTAVDAEALAKAALLSGPGRACEWLTHGGLLVHEDGSVDLLDPPHEQLDDDERPLHR